MTDNLFLGDLSASGHPKAPILIPSSAPPPTPPATVRPSATRSPFRWMRTVERRFEAAADPFADRLAVGLFGIAKTGTRASRVSNGLSARECWPVATPAEDGMGLSMSILPDGTLRIGIGESLRSRQHAPARHSRARGHVATERWAATCGIVGVSAERALSCPRTPNVDWTLALRPRWQGSGPGNFPPNTTGGDAFRREVSSAQIVQTINRETNRTMARTKRSRRSYGAGEWAGTG